jgi:hypothetical protein
MSEQLGAATVSESAGAPAAGTGEPRSAPRHTGWGRRSGRSSPRT